MGRAGFLPRRAVAHAPLLRRQGRPPTYAARGGPRARPDRGLGGGWGGRFYTAAGLERQLETAAAGFCRGGVAVDEPARKVRPRVHGASAERGGG